jgi:hypothetical protein
MESGNDHKREIILTVSYLFKSTGYWFFVVALFKERKQALAPFIDDPAPPVLISFLIQN